MRIGLVSGDGLPVSGLLTIFRNVISLGAEMKLLDLPVPAEFGYSWRPDKPIFFPYGPPAGQGNVLLEPAREPAPDVGDRERAAAEWTKVRASVARADRLSPTERTRLHQRIDRLAAPYHAYFLRWIRETEIDWVCAINMTLSDAVPVTKALHAAARDRYADNRSGGVLFWDHDLFGSCAVRDDGGVRMYPENPNEFTPLPQDEPFLRWAVVSEFLAAEIKRYPTSAQPRVVPNILPRVPTGPLDLRHQEFLAGLHLAPGRPIILNPVRVFRVKGVEIALELLAAARSASANRGFPAPYLLVFGSLDEDPKYAEEVLGTARQLDLLQDVRFLDGVPLHSERDADGRWRLDEIDLLRVAAASGGGVVFTPNTADVETVGLGPALAAVAGLPCATTAYDAFVPVYGRDFCVTPVSTSFADMAQAGTSFVQAMQASRDGSAIIESALSKNRRIVENRFPVGPWAELMKELAASSARTIVEGCSA